MLSLAPDLFGLLQSAVDSAGTRLVVERSWLDTLGVVAQSLISLLVLVLLVVGVMLLYALRKSVEELSKVIKSAHGPLHAAIAESREVTGEVRAIARSLKAPLAYAGETIDDASERLQDVMQSVERRLLRFDALVDIVQEEAEDTVLSAASLMRGVRAGGEVIGRSLGLTRGERARSRRRVRDRDRNGGRHDSIRPHDDEDVPDDERDDDLDTEAPRIRSRAVPHR